MLIIQFVPTVLSFQLFQLYLLSLQVIKIPHSGDTDSLDVCGKQHCVNKRNKKCWSNLELLLIFKALCVDDPEQNAGTIHASNQEHLLVFKAPRWDDPEKNAGTIHASNQEHLLIFKALRRDNPEQNAGTIHTSNPEHLLF